MRGESTQLAKLLSIIFVSSVLFACGSSDPANDSTNNIIESTVGTISHNMGMDCLSSTCHGSLAPADRPHFIVAGSVYPAPANSTTPSNATVEIINVSGHALVKSIPVNNSGNFYSTDGSIKLNGTMTAWVRNTATNAVTQPMSSIVIGDCNGCHLGADQLNRP